MKSEKLKNIFLLLTTLIIVFLIFEIFLRLFKPQIFDIHPKGMYISDSRVGYLLNPDFQGFIEREEFKQFFRVNSKGLRGQEIGIKQKDSYRILILGDSYTFGFGVKENETFSAYLQQCLSKKTNRKIEVINGGIPGYGTVDQLNLLKAIGNDINPDLIILQFLSTTDFTENRDPAVEWADVRDGYLTSKSHYWEKTHSSGNNFLSFKNLISWVKSNLHAGKFLSERLGYLMMRFNLSGGMESFWGEDFTKEDEQITINSLKRILQYSKNIGSKLLLLYTVGQGQVISTNQNELRSEKFISNFTEAQNMQWINTLREMRKRQDRNELYFPIDGHWTAKGHYAVSEMICKMFTEEFSSHFSVN